jgi:hypothetical protein
MARLGRLPAVGDEILVPVDEAAWRLTVSDMDRRRIVRVALTFLPPTPVPAQTVSAEVTESAGSTDSGESAESTEDVVFA